MDGSFFSTPLAYNQKSYSLIPQIVDARPLETAYENREVFEVLDKWLGTLGFEDLLILYAIHNLEVTQAEVARLLKRSEMAISKRLRRLYEKGQQDLLPLAV